jgi:DNA (cytosine-5)-methyltransferase 1
MAEIRARPRAGLKVASTFTGAGGSYLGFEMEGYEHVYASEFVPAARDTFAANFPGDRMDDRDVRLVRPEDVLGPAGLEVGELDVLEGSPPCASFSTAGKRSKGWGEVKKYSDVEQRTDDLFFEYVRLLRGTLPRTFVAENVSGLVKGVAKGYFLQILRELKSCGYRVGVRVLDAQWLGVPQQRQRTIFVGVREDLGLDPAFPTPLPYRYSIRDALPWIGGLTHDTSRTFSKGPVDVEREPVPAITVGAGGMNSLHYKVTDAPVRMKAAARARRARGSFHGRTSFDGDDPAPTIGAQGMVGTDEHEIEVLAPAPPDIRFRTGWQAGEGIDPAAPAPTLMADGLGGSCYRQLEVRAPAPPTDAELAEASIRGKAIEGEWRKLRPGEQSERYFNLVRPDPDQPVPCVTQTGGVVGAASVTHPHEPRKFTMAELRRLGGFPDDFVLTGTYRQQWERIGRAVPPVMMAHVARVLRDEVLLRAPK